jgi:hypothetical protein
LIPRPVQRPATTGRFALKAAAGTTTADLIAYFLTVPCQLVASLGCRNAGVETVFVTPLGKFVPPWTGDGCGFVPLCSVPTRTPEPPCVFTIVVVSFFLPAQI